MGLFETIRERGVSYHPSEEELYAEVLREVETDVRRSGLWARALSESDMDNDKARAAYIKLRVQTLKEEASSLISELVGEQAAAIEKRTNLLALAEQEVIDATKRAESAIDDVKKEAAERIVEAEKKVTLTLNESRQEVSRANSICYDVKLELSRIQDELAAVNRLLENERSSMTTHRWLVWTLGSVVAAGLYMIFTGILQISWAR